MNGSANGEFARGGQAFVDRCGARLLPWLQLRCVEVWLGPGETL